MELHQPLVLIAVELTFRSTASPPWKPVVSAPISIHLSENSEQNGSTPGGLFLRRVTVRSSDEEKVVEFAGAGSWSTALSDNFSLSLL